MKFLKKIKVRTFEKLNFFKDLKKNEYSNILKKLKKMKKMNKFKYLENEKKKMKTRRKNRKRRKNSINLKIENFGKGKKSETINQINMSRRDINVFMSR